jgi:hypothetical protein
LKEKEEKSKRRDGFSKEKNDFLHQGRCKNNPAKNGEFVSFLNEIQAKSRHNRND